MDDPEGSHSTKRQLADELAKARTLQQISTELITQHDIGKLYAKLLEAAMALMKSDFASVQMLDPGTASLQLLASKHFHPDAERHWQHVEAGSSTPCGQALAQATRVIVTDVEACAFILGTPDHDAFRQCGIRAVQSTPLVARDGAPLGMISTHWRVPHAPTAGDLRSFDVLARQAADLLERTRAEDALRRAHSDLEQRVQTRTTDLAKANTSLETEVRDRRSAERRVQALFQRLVSVQEEERRRIARDIDDQIGQRMTALRMSLDAVEPDRDPARQAQLNRAQALAEQLDRAVDALTSSLRPTALEDLGLAGALEGLISNWSGRFQIDASFDSACAESRQLHPEVASNLYRLVQEALRNIVTHARATRVTVSLTQRAGSATLVIDDDGCGFDPEEVQARPGHGLGLANMRERALLLGGDLDVDSMPGRGTTILVRVPAWRQAFERV